MDSTLPPDPYKALGLTRDADQALIKSTYRKLALKCHPDKVTDESLKKQKQEEFHKIQQAYEVIGDEAKRDRYEAELRLETLRREKAARCSGSGGESRAGGRYETRTQAPAGATSSARYEERKSSQAYDDRYHDERSRKYETREAAPKYSSPRSSREKDSPSKTTRSSADRTRSDHKKSRDKEGRQDRDRKYASAESEGSADDGKARYEAEYRRRSEDARKERVAEEIRRDAADARRKAEERRSYDEKLDRQRKMSELESDAVRYIHRSKVEMERPSPSRTNSTRDVRPGEYTESRSRRDRPDAVRRSSARPKDRIAMSSSGRDRERSNIQIVDWEAESVRPAPTFKHSSSPPAEIHLASRAPPQRSFTESSRDHRRAEDAFLPPPYRRSETLPIHKSLRPEMAPSRPSVLRESVTPGASNLEPSSTTTKTYYAYPTSDAYPTSGGGFRLADDVSVANGHRTVLHEPSTREPSARHRQRSKSPLTRPPIGLNRLSEAPSYTTSAPKNPMMPPTLGRSATMNVSPTRGRSTRLYGEVGAASESLRRENTRRQSSLSPNEISYAKKYGPEDVKWAAPRGRDPPMGKDPREYAKPSLNRNMTSVY